jgi:hypothetical protein
MIKTRSVLVAASLFGAAALAVLGSPAAVAQTGGAFIPVTHSN